MKSDKPGRLREASLQLEESTTAVRHHEDRFPAVDMVPQVDDMIDFRMYCAHKF
jgi:hypothetical protein